MGILLLVQMILVISQIPYPPQIYKELSINLAATVVILRYCFCMTHYSSFHILSANTFTFTLHRQNEHAHLLFVSPIQTDHSRRP